MLGHICPFYFFLVCLNITDNHLGVLKLRLVNNM